MQTVVAVSTRCVEQSITFSPVAQVSLVETFTLWIKFMPQELNRTDPSTYREQFEAGYIRGVREDQPAVIQLNSLIASMAVNEFLARLHPYRIDPNSEYSILRISISHGIYEQEPDGESCQLLGRHVGRGDVSPPLDWAELSLSKEVA